MRAIEIIFDNPIFVRELRRRMRKRGLILTLIIYIAALCLLSYFTVTWMSRDLSGQRFYSGQMRQSLAVNMTAADIGKTLFSRITFIEQFLVLLVAPVLTAALVYSERERNTFDFLRATAISAPTFVAGAFMSTLIYVVLALFCALPVMMVAYMYGGVSHLIRET